MQEIIAQAFLQASSEVFPAGKRLHKMNRAGPREARPAAQILPRRLMPSGELHPPGADSFSKDQSEALSNWKGRSTEAVSSSKMAFSP